MNGLATYAATKRSLIGIDWLNLASGTLKGAGGAFGGGGGSDAVAVAEKVRFEVEKKVVEEWVNTWKLVDLGVLLVAGTVYFVERKE